MIRKNTSLFREITFNSTQPSSVVCNNILPILGTVLGNPKFYILQPVALSEQAAVSSSKSVCAKLSSQLQDLRKQNILYKKELNHEEGLKTNLTKQWNEIESPFGKLPIELHILLALFPLALIGGFCICTPLF